MPIGVLTVLKLVLLALLYLFLLRVVRVIAADLYGRPTRKAASPPTRQPVATAQPAPRRARRPARELVLHAPDAKPLVVALSGERVVIGRAEPAAVIVEDIYVSDEHAELALADTGWVVRDLGSTNGTFLNGAKVIQPTPVIPGDQLRVGKTRIEVRR